MRQQRWLEYTKDYDCTIKYTAGKSNLVADSLSQMFNGIVKRGDSGDRTKGANFTALWHQSYQ